jgi:hypothetical protein
MEHDVVKNVVSDLPELATAILANNFRVKKKRARPAVADRARKNIFVN